MRSTTHGAVRSERSKVQISLLARPAVYLTIGVLIGLLASYAVLHFQGKSSSLLNSYNDFRQLEADADAMSDIPDGISAKCWDMLLKRVSHTEQLPNGDDVVVEHVRYQPVSGECDEFMPQRFK
jgi:hypothetical protein